jgi:hypothetical protein
MYDSNHRLTFEGAQQVIREGGSVSMGGQVFTKLEHLPNAVQFAANGAITREQAENAIKQGGQFSYNGKNYTRIDQLPDAEVFDENNRQMLADARGKLQAELDERREALNEADRISREASDNLARAEQMRRLGTRNVTSGGVGPRNEEDETYGDENLTLAQLDGLSDEQILEKPGIGDATLHKIKLARGKRDRAAR